MSRIVLTRRLPEAFAPILDRVDAWQWDQDRPMSPAELRFHLAEAEGVLCMVPDPIDGTVMGDRLRVISQMAVGVDNVDVEEATRRGIPVGHTP
ncbi:MAG: D-glycerate dehydrogenase, partial [Acidimicrobiia bacterium]|nr:D-glycerate dehydrogenase [Acidimicrobiia bacterium]